MKGIGKTGIGFALSLGLIAGGYGQAEGQAVGMEAMADDPRITIDLSGTGGAALAGEAVLSAEEDRTDVAIELTGAPAGTSLVGVLVSGMCTEGGEVIAQLGSIDTNAEGEGELSAELPIDLATIASAPVAVEVRGATPESNAIACGQHLAVSETDAIEPAAEVAPPPLPEAPAPAPETPALPEPMDDPVPDPIPAPQP